MAGNHMSTLSPRQRMINMMYLVLTALLALNVSKEVLDAFFRVDQTLTVTVSDKIEAADHRYEVLEKNLIMSLTFSTDIFFFSSSLFFR